MKHFGHGHKLHIFSFQTLIPSCFPCLVSNTYNSSFCEVHHNVQLKIMLYISLVGIIFIALNCKFSYITFVPVKHLYAKIYYKWEGPRKYV